MTQREAEIAHWALRKRSIQSRIIGRGLPLTSSDVEVQVDHHRFTEFADVKEFLNADSREDRMDVADQIRHAVRTEALSCSTQS